MYVQLCYNTCILYIIVCGIMFKIEYVKNGLLHFPMENLKTTYIDMYLLILFESYHIMVYSII